MLLTRTANHARGQAWAPGLHPRHGCSARTIVCGCFSRLRRLSCRRRHHQHPRHHRLRPGQAIAGQECVCQLCAWGAFGYSAYAPCVQRGYRSGCIRPMAPAPFGMPLQSLPPWRTCPCRRSSPNNFHRSQTVHSLGKDPQLVPPLQLPFHRAGLHRPPLRGARGRPLLRCAPRHPQWVGAARRVVCASRSIDLPSLAPQCFGAECAASVRPWRRLDCPQCCGSLEDPVLLLRLGSGRLTSNAWTRAAVRERYPSLAKKRPWMGVDLRFCWHRFGHSFLRSADPPSVLGAQPPIPGREHRCYERQDADWTPPPHKLRVAPPRLEHDWKDLPMRTQK